MFRFDQYGIRKNPTYQQDTTMTSVHNDKLALPQYEPQFQSDEKDYDDSFFHDMFREDDFFATQKFDPVLEESERQLREQIELASRNASEQLNPVNTQK